MWTFLADCQGVSETRGENYPAAGETLASHWSSGGYPLLLAESRHPPHTIGPAQLTQRTREGRKTRN